MDDSHKIVGHPLPNVPQDGRKDRSTAKTCHCYNPVGLSWGQMNEINWSVMKSRFDSGKLVREGEAEVPGWPYQLIMVEGMPGALAAEPEASAAADAKAMPKAGRLALAAEKAKPNKIPTQPPPQRRIAVMTLGVQLCLRWFIEG